MDIENLTEQNVWDIWAACRMTRVWGDGEGVTYGHTIDCGYTDRPFSGLIPASIVTSLEGGDQIDIVRNFDWTPSFDHRYSIGQRSNGEVYLFCHWRGGQNEALLIPEDWEERVYRYFGGELIDPR